MYRVIAIYRTNNKVEVDHFDTPFTSYTDAHRLARTEARWECTVAAAVIDPNLDVTIYEGEFSSDATVVNAL